MTTINLGKIIPQKYLDYWTPEDIAEIEGYINQSVADSLGDYEKCLDKIVQIQNTIIGKFGTPTDNRTSLAYWYQYLGDNYVYEYDNYDDMNIVLKGTVIEDMPFPVGTQNIISAANFTSCYIYNSEDGYYNSSAAPIKKFSGTLDLSSATSLSSMFSGSQYLVDVGEIKSPKSTNFSNMFSYSGLLVTVRGVDLRSATNVTGMLSYTSAMENLTLKNIGISLTVGSGNAYGHLLTVDSLIGLIYELRNTGSSKTLTMGNANLAKLSNIYVRTIDITDKMRAEDDLIDEKLPFEVCESTDEGAMLITDYVTLKNWVLK